MDSYIHVQLPAGNWFRILRLHPGTFDEPIRCELIATELDDPKLSYEPISYCWDLSAYPQSDDKENLLGRLKIGFRKWIRSTNLDRDKCLEFGRSIFNREITCDGLAFFVTTNLFQALQRFRLATTPRNLWADAVCIDQQSIKERGHQVGLMVRIISSFAQLDSVFLLQGSIPRRNIHS
jgi:hypothetical protein